MMIHAYNYGNRLFHNLGEDDDRDQFVKVDIKKTTNGRDVSSLSASQPSESTSTEGIVLKIILKLFQKMLKTPAEQNANAPLENSEQQSVTNEIDEINFSAIRVPEPVYEIIPIPTKSGDGDDFNDMTGIPPKDPLNDPNKLLDKIVKQWAKNQVGENGPLVEAQRHQERPGVGVEEHPTLSFEGLRALLAQYYGHPNRLFDTYSSASSSFPVVDSSQVPVNANDVSIDPQIEIFTDSLLKNDVKLFENVCKDIPNVLKTLASKKTPGMLLTIPLLLYFLYNSKETKLNRVIGSIIAPEKLTKLRVDLVLPDGKCSVEFAVKAGESIHMPRILQTDSETLFETKGSLLGPLENFRWKRQENHLLGEVYVKNPGNPELEDGPVTTEVPITDLVSFKITEFDPKFTDINLAEHNSSDFSDSKWDGIKTVTFEIPEPFDSEDAEKTIKNSLPLRR